MASVDKMTAGVLKVKPESLDSKKKWNGWLWPYGEFMLSPVFLKDLKHH